MKAIAVTLVMLSALAAAQTWSTRAPIPTPRWNPASVVLDGRIYLIGGQDSAAPWRSIPTVEAYDPGTDRWETRAPMNFDRWGLAAAVVNGRVYAMGGRRGPAGGGHSPTAVVEEYDPVADTWFVRDSMPTPRGYCGCAVWQDTVFVLGGRRGSSQILNVVEKYVPAADTWLGETPMPTARYTFGLAQVGEKAYLAGGWNTNLVEELDFATRQWATKAPMPTARGTAGVAVYSDWVFVVGGRGGQSNELECYVPELDTWLVLNTMPTPREGLVAAAVGGTLYAITGSKPLNQGGLPYYGENEAATGLIGLDEVRWVPPPHGRAELVQTGRSYFLLRYAIEKPGRVAVVVYDALGRVARRLHNGQQGRGCHELVWDGLSDNGRIVGPGAYLYRLDAEDIRVTLKCVIAG